MQHHLEHTLLELTKHLLKFVSISHLSSSKIS
nr:MAG TPA: hypothetical protein [Caudoviricetes sp.]